MNRAPRLKKREAPGSFCKTPKEHRERVPLQALTERVFLLCYHRQLWRHLGAQFSKRLPFCRQIVLVKNCFYRTLWNTCLTVNAFIWMNVNHLIAFVKAFDRANNNTVCVLAGEAGLSNDMRHIRLTPYQEILNQPLCNYAHRHSKRAKKLLCTDWENRIDIDERLNSGIVGSIEPPVNEISIG